MYLCGEFQHHTIPHNRRFRRAHKQSRTVCAA